METQTTSPTTPTPNAPDPASLAAKYQAINAAGLAAIAAIRASVMEVTDIESPHPDTVRFVQSMKGFPRPFLDRSLELVQQTPGYQAVERFDIQVVQNQIAASDGLHPLANALRLLFIDLGFTADVNYARAMNQGLQIYQIGQGLARDTVRGAAYVPGINDLKSALGRAGIRKANKAAKQKPPAAPATPPLNAKPPLVN